MTTHPNKRLDSQDGEGQPPDTAGRPCVEAPTPWRRRALAALLGLCCLAFVALGWWQVQRLAWKRDLIARVESRVQAAPVAPPGVAAWPDVMADPASYEYRRVALTGRFLHEQEALVQATTEHGAGFWLLTPLRQQHGDVVFVNRGFVPPAARTPDARLASRCEGTVTVQGLLRLPEPGGGFLRTNDPAADRWHSRDVAAIATARGLEAGQVAPYFMDADAASACPGDPWPAGGLTVIRFSNSHLVYAVTWFLLALMSVAALRYLFREEQARRESPWRKT